MSRRAGAHRLPSPGLVHLFWALFWHDKVQSHPMQAFWILKLASHARRAQVPSLLGQALPAKVTEALLQAILFAVDGCLRR